MTYRENLEIEIIGQLVCFNASFTKVGGILSSANFKAKVEGIPCSYIFKAISTIYPLIPIDFITVTKEVHKLLPKESYGNVAYGITQSANRTLHDTNLEYHCMLLLQLNIEDEFLRILSEMDDTRSAVLKEAKQDFFRSLQLGYDLFEVVQKSEKYLIGLGFTKEAEKLTVLNDNIVKKTVVLRSQTQLQTLTKNIEGLCNLNVEKKDKLKDHVFGIIKLMGY